MTRERKTERQIERERNGINYFFLFFTIELPTMTNTKNLELDRYK